ncbi:MAG: hypothetical protein ACWA5P_01190 [bacterium]
MKKQVEKIVGILGLLLFLLASNYSQGQRGFDRFALDVKYGMSIPLTPTETIKASEYLFPRHISLGLRYNFREFFGAKVSFAHDRFQPGFNTTTGNSYYRLSLEGVYNFTSHLGITNNYEINALFHLGVGLTRAYPEAIRRFRNGGEFTFGLTPENTLDYERIGNIIVGITPQYRISDRVALVFDLSYIFNTQQQYYYNGELISIDRKKVKGGFINLTFGLQFYFGSYGRHADWYSSF